MQNIDVNMEQHDGGPVFRAIRSKPQKRAAEDFEDQPARLTPRQAIFFRNLISLAEKLQSRKIPIAFNWVGKGPVQMDHGCVKMAEHSGFVQPLQNNKDGYVDSVTLNFMVVVE